MAKFPKPDFGIGPAWKAVDVSENNHVVSGGQAIGFYATGAGDVVFVSDGVTITLTVAANALIPARFTQINTSGTTATGIFVLQT